MTTIKQWLHENAIEEVEAIIPDFAGTGRGKFVPTERYLEDEGIRIAEALFTQTIDGEYTDYVDDINPTDVDMELRPDPESIRIVPWAPHPTAQIIHDCYHLDGTPVETAPRYILKRVLGGQFAPFLKEARETSATFSGQPGKLYSFLCSAKDTAGNIEDQDLVAETETLVSAHTIRKQET